MFKVGDKVETPFGVGTIVAFNYHLGMDGCKSYKIRLDYKMDDSHSYEEGKAPLLNFTTNELKPYKTAHDKLIELGYQYKEDESEKQYTMNHDYIIIIDKELKTICFDTSSGHSYSPSMDLELSKILTQYLQELKEEG